MAGDSAGQKASPAVVLRSGFQLFSPALAKRAKPSVTSFA